MPIPVGRLYQKKELGNGTVGSIENNTVNTITAGADIQFGAAVNIQDGKAVTATKAPIFGIAVKRTFIWGDDYNAIENDKWKAGEVIGALRKGAIAVPITADVNRYDAATVNADGTFKPAGSSDAVVGRFLTAGDAGKTAILQVELTDMTAGGSSSATPAAPSNNSKSAGTNGSGASNK